ncbi:MULTISPECIES: RluA family pseudouridine synthase [unclassified Mycoplasma]|uniref:RluA family pseudouridine synthase n=1 Tax=unclassified Mycoplasma TaxID=2683645 RepID=UPI000FDE6F7A
MEKATKLTAQKNERIDKHLAENLSFSRTQIRKLIDQQRVSVNGNLVRKANFVLQPGQLIEISTPKPKESKVKAEDLPIDVVYEDDDIIVVNKPSGLVVHPAPGNLSGTLVNALVGRYQKLSHLGGQDRPGTVHRLDKDTSGLILFAKNDEIHAQLAKALKERQIKRIYLAWVVGKIEKRVIHINLPIGRDVYRRQRMRVQSEKSKPALTHVYVLQSYPDKTLVRCELESGRTHQIRVHLAHIGHPVVGDPKYGKLIDNFGQRLHAYQLIFLHPRSGKKMFFEVDPPPEFNDWSFKNQPKT